MSAFIVQSIVAIAMLVISSHSFAHEFYMEVTGVTQGAFKGENAAGQIPLYGYSFNVTSAFDAGTGQLTGKHQYQPIVVTKNLDLATPQLLKALVNNERLSTVVIEAYNTTKDGKIEHAYTITLTNAVVVAVNQQAAPNEMQTEQVSFTFQTIQITNADLTAQDDWFDQ